MKREKIKDGCEKHYWEMWLDYILLTFLKVYLLYLMCNYVLLDCYGSGYRIRSD